MITAQIDPRSLAALNKKIIHIGNTLGGAERTPVGDLINSAALRVETIAKKNLRAGGHIVTGRLWTSIHAQLKPSETFTYSDNLNESFNGTLKDSVEAGKSVIVGTNVEYAPKIENMDSCLYAASQEIKPELERRAKKLVKDTVNEK